MEPSSTAIIRTLAPTGAATFEELFRTHFRGLHAYACTILKDPHMAEEMVQQVFVKVWEKREDLTIHTSVKAYLYRSVYHESLNYLKHKKVMAGYASYAVRNAEHTATNSDNKLRTTELTEMIRDAMNELPEQCRTIFQLSRFEHMKYQEIADTMGLSVKTIENQMGKGLRLMRSKLAEYITLFLSWIILTIN